MGIRNLLTHIHIGLSIDKLMFRHVVGELDLGDHLLIALAQPHVDLAEDLAESMRHRDHHPWLGDRTADS